MYKRQGLSRSNYSFSEKICLREYELADYIIVPSEYAYNSFIKYGVPKERLFLRPYGVDTQKFIPKTKEDKIFLLKLARNVISAECRGEHYRIPPYTSKVFDEPRGAFVTLHKHGQLRGCIGYIEPIKPLVETIVEMAKAAAFNDWRFPPVKAEEVPELDIEISILSPIKEIKDTNEIVVGKHGIIITRGMHRGLLLPQVATEWGWDREKFLEQTCLKAGLPTDAWKEKGTKIEIFSAEIFNEKELGLK